MRQRNAKKGTLLLAALLVVVAGGLGLRSLSHDLVIENHSKAPISVRCGDFEAANVARAEARRVPRAVFGLSADCAIRRLPEPSGGELKCSTPLGPGSSLRIELRESGVLFCGEWD